MKKIKFVLVVSGLALLLLTGTVQGNLSGSSDIVSTNDLPNQH